eukprot:359416-Chlamydomonas_euryale.AAC.20
MRSRTPTPHTLPRRLTSDIFPTLGSDAAIRFLEAVAWRGWRPPQPAWLPNSLQLLLRLCWHAVRLLLSLAAAAAAEASVSCRLPPPIAAAAATSAFCRLPPPVAADAAAAPASCRLLLPVATAAAAPASCGLPLPVKVAAATSASCRLLLPVAADAAAAPASCRLPLPVAADAAAAPASCRLPPPIAAAAAAPASCRLLPAVADAGHPNRLPCHITWSICIDCWPYLVFKWGCVHVADYTTWLSYGLIQTDHFTYLWVNPTKGKPGLHGTSVRRRCRAVLNGERYPPFTVHPVNGNRSEAGPSPTCRARISGPLTHTLVEPPTRP